MYFNKAVNRINKIVWSKIESPIDNNEMYLGYEYLRRMAGFLKEQSLKPINPLFINVASILGDKQENDYIEYCSKEVQDAVKDKALPKAILNFFLQLANYADNNKNAEPYMQIYDPLIQLLEKGYIFAFREAGLMIYNVGYFPLSGWYDRFVEALPISFLDFFYILDDAYNQCKEDDLGGFLGAISPEIWEDGKPIDKAIFNDWQKFCKPETINENNIIKRTYDFLDYYEKKFEFDFSKTKRWLISIDDKEIVKKALKRRRGI